MLRPLNDGRRLLPSILDNVLSFANGFFAGLLKGRLRLNPGLFPAFFCKLATPDARLFGVRPSLFLRCLDDTIGLGFGFENSLYLRFQRHHAPLASQNLWEL